VAIAGTYASTATRIAATCDPIYDYMKTVLQLDTNTIYRCIRGGTGEECWESVYVLDDLTSSFGVSLYSFREVSSGGDVGNVAAIGGVLASDTAPIMRGDAAETAEISWATTVVDPISAHVTLPKDFSGASNVTIEFQVYSGSTDAASFTVETGWDGAALVSDAVDDSSTKSATLHTVTATIAAADVPNSARNLTIALTPPAHATNAIQLCGVCVIYERLRAA
jgi:hypothetical protein